MDLSAPVAGLLLAGGVEQPPGVSAGVGVAAGEVRPPGPDQVPDRGGREAGQAGAVAGQLGEGRLAGGPAQLGQHGADRVVGAYRAGRGLPGEEHPRHHLGDRADLERGAGLHRAAGPVAVAQAGGADAAVLQHGDGEAAVAPGVGQRRADVGGQRSVAGALRGSRGSRGMIPRAATAPTRPTIRARTIGLRMVLPSVGCFRRVGAHRTGRGFDRAAGCGGSAAGGGEDGQQRHDPLGRDGVVAPAGAAQPAGGGELAQVVVQLAGGAEALDLGQLAGAVPAAEDLPQQAQPHRVREGGSTPASSVQSPASTSSTMRPYCQS